MEYLLAHLFGEVILQHEWMLVRKNKVVSAIFSHSVVYVIPFLFLAIIGWLNYQSLLLIYGAHLVFETLNIANIWIAKVQQLKLSRSWEMLIDHSWHIILVYLIIYLF